MRNKSRNINGVESATNIYERGNEEFSIVEGVVNVSNKR